MFKKVLHCVLLVSISVPMMTTLAEDSVIAIAIHGGAGTISRDDLNAEQEQAFRDKLDEALTTGYTILENGGSSLDAVVAAIQILEDSPLFNAGKGAVFTHDGTNELDASIMDGKTLKAGAVAGVKRIANPIALARHVMDDSPHVLLVGQGAEEFAAAQGMDFVPEKYFHTPHRWNQLQERRNEDPRVESLSDSKFGTVGAVALDRAGNLAAGTSTGGMTNKRYGRVGDSPIIGAGTYANNATVAVSGTGHGEYFIRSVVAYDVSAQMEYSGATLTDAMKNVVHKKLVKTGGSGGLIAVDSKGNVSLEHNTEGMYRGYVDKDGNKAVRIYKD